MSYQYLVAFLSVVHYQAASVAVAQSQLCVDLVDHMSCNKQGVVLYFNACFATFGYILPYSLVACWIYHKSAIPVLQSC